MRLLRPLLALLLVAPFLQAQSPALDSDHDGLSDAFEQSLLQQFQPAFIIGKHDCAGLPAVFQPNHLSPTPLSADGTVYGQVFLAPHSTPTHPLIEVHYYHLWTTDCGAHGHPLDTEHVAVLLHPTQPGTPLDQDTWQAVDWYAAAHENTVCDVSQISRASTLHAQDHGATVWVSPGKHASYLNEVLCSRGCGADRCEDMTPLQVTRIVNLGEPGHPMNGSLFIASSVWPLASKMSASNFPDEPLARLNQLPADDIAWFNPGRHPAQGIIAISSTTEDAIALGGHDTSSTLSTAHDHTGNALDKTYRNTVHALGTSAHHVGKFLHPKPTTPPPAAQPQ